jgi:hypothetical protein
MEGSASTHGRAPSALEPAGTTVQQGGHGGRHLAMLFVAGVLAIYIVIGIAVYSLVTVLL